MCGGGGGGGGGVFAEMLDSCFVCVSVGRRQGWCRLCVCVDAHVYLHACVCVCEWVSLHAFCSPVLVVFSALSVLMGIRIQLFSTSLMN